MQPIFNAVTPSLSQACFNLHLQGQYSPWSRKIFNDCLTPPYFADCLTINGQVVGYYIAMPVLDEVTLMDIVVDKSHQGNGFGKILLQHFIQQCTQRKAVQLWLEVRESNKAAITLYEKQNFVLIEQRKNYYPSANGKEDALIMGLYLGGFS